MKSVATRLFIILILIGGSFGLINFYPYIFVRNVIGVIENIDRVSNPMAIMAGGQMPSKEILFSYAVAIKENNGEIVTASSVDRQWAVAEKGKCAEAKYYPYPPWELDKSGTYYNARLLKLYDCPKNPSK